MGSGPTKRPRPLPDCGLNLTLRVVTRCPIRKVVRLCFFQLALALPFPSHASWISIRTASVLPVLFKIWILGSLFLISSEKYVCFAFERCFGGENIRRL